jgi:hypothetical protein
MRKQLLKKVLLTSIIIYQYCPAIAQDFSRSTGGISTATDISGKPVYLKTEYRAEGSPYYYEDYCVADITATDGKVYTAVKVKINLLENKVLYLLDDGSEMLATTPLVKIKLYPYVRDGKAYPLTILQSIGDPINKENTKIYAVLVDSTAKLFKQIVVTYSDSKGYGEASITRTFNKSENYFASIPSSSLSLQKIEKNKSAVTSLFGAQKEKIAAYIEQEKLNCRSEQDLIRIFKYYHTLVQS